LYREQYVSHNIHGLTHLAQDVLKFSNLDKFSAFKFENFLQIFKYFIRKGEEPFQQITRRYSEYIYKKKTKILETSFVNTHADGPLINNCCSPQFKSVSILWYI